MGVILQLSDNVFFIKLGKGEDILESLKKLLPKTGFEIGFVTGIGGLEKARIGVFRGDSYDEITVEPLEGHVLEVASLQGNFAKSPSGEYYPHLHIVVVKYEREVYGGHVLKGCIVNPFLEIFVHAFPGKANVIAEFKHRWSI